MRESPRPVVRRFASKPLTARRAGSAIALATLAVTIAGALLIWLLDNDEFGSLGDSIWFTVQTVTTVGYGDITPRSTSGRIIGVVVMLAGIGFLTVVTAAITAAFIEEARRRLRAQDGGDPVAAALADITERLERIERRLDRER